MVKDSKTARQSDRSLGAILRGEGGIGVEAVDEKSPGCGGATRARDGFPHPSLCFPRS